MFKLSLFLLPLLAAASLATGQQVALSAGYLYVGEPSFTGAPIVSLRGNLPLGPHLLSGISLSAARHRQPYQEFIPGFLGVGGRQITEYHNYLYAVEAILAGRVQLGSHLRAALSLSAGRAFLGARQRSEQSKWSAGIWANAAYKLGQGRFHLEATVQPQVLFGDFPVDDSNGRFDGQRLHLWNTQLGVSYDLGKQP